MIAFQSSTPENQNILGEDGFEQGSPEKDSIEKESLREESRKETPVEEVWEF